MVDTLRVRWPKLKPGGLYVLEDLFVKVGEQIYSSYRGAAQGPNLEGLQDYTGWHDGEQVLPQHGVLPSGIQDLEWVHRENIPDDVKSLLLENNHFFATTAVSADGGLHTVLVIQKKDAVRVALESEEWW